MPLIFAPAPKNGISLVQAGLSKLSTRTSPLTGVVVNFAALEVAAPHAVYDLRADAVAAGGGLASAVLTGYRYLIAGGGTAVAAAEVHADATGTATLLANINYGPFVQSTAQALRRVADLPTATAESFEARMLRFSAIALVAIWLKPVTGAGDIVYPVAPAPPGLQAGQPYSEANFISAILPLAQRRAGKTDPNSVP